MHVCYSAQDPSKNLSKEMEAVPGADHFGMHWHTPSQHLVTVANSSTKVLTHHVCCSH